MPIYTDTFDPLSVDSYVSIGNSTNTILSSTGASSFTGLSEDVSQYSSVTFALKTDQSGCAYMDFSTDGINWDSQVGFIVHACENEFHRLSPVRQYYRLRIQNTSGSDQTYLRAQSIYGDQKLLTSTQNSTISNDADSIVTRSTDSPVYIAKGLVEGSELFEKFGYNFDLDSSAEATIWPVSGSCNFMTSASTFTFVSDNASDTSDGAGARTLQIRYVASDYTDTTDYVILNGTNPVSSSFTGLGINRVQVYTAGSIRKNSGSILVTSNGSTQALVPTSDSITHQLVYHIPLGKSIIPTLYFVGADRVASQDPVITVNAYRLTPNNVIIRYFTHTFNTAAQSDFIIQSDAFSAIEEKNRIFITACTNQDNTRLTGRFHFIQANNT